MSILGELEELLEEEQLHLLSGDFTALESLIVRKSKLAQQLAARSPDLCEKTYETLVRRARHNEALLDSARRGLQAAMAQLKQVSEGETQMTYSKEGQRKTLSRNPTSLTQKL